MSAPRALWRKLDPRSSVASRLLLGFLLAFCIPGGAFVFLLEQRLSELERGSARQLAGIRVSDALARMSQDVRFRTEWIDRRARMLEEASANLSDALELALQQPATHSAEALGTAEWQLRSGILSEHAANPAAREALARAKSVLLLLGRVLERRPAVVGITVSAAPGARLRVARAGAGTPSAEGESSAESSGSPEPAAIACRTSPAPGRPGPATGNRRVVPLNYRRRPRKAACRA